MELSKLENEMFNDCLKNNKQIIYNTLDRAINGPQEQKLEIFKELFKLIIENEIEKNDAFPEFEEFYKYKNTCTMNTDDSYIPEIFEIVEEYRRIYQECKPEAFLVYSMEFKQCSIYEEAVKTYEEYTKLFENSSYNHLKYIHNKDIYKFMKNYENEVKNICKDYLCQDLITIVLDYF